MRFKSLGSGSTGNATVVETTGAKPSRLLIDCGFGLKQLTARLSKAGLVPEDINAIFITHEHGDHVGCSVGFALRYCIPIWMSQGSYEALASPDLQNLRRVARDSEPIDLGVLQITPFTVPHDAKEPLQLTCTDGSVKLGVVTDLGHATSHVINHLKRCDAVVLECNHDTDLLESSSYPAFLKKRVGGAYGHLSNAASAGIAAHTRHADLQIVVAAHLSQQNNTQELVHGCLSQVLATTTDIVVATPEEGCAWIRI